MQPKRKKNKSGWIAWTFGCVVAWIVLSVVMLVLLMPFGLASTQVFNFSATYEPKSGAYRQLQVEADGLVQSAMDGEPEADEVRLSFASNDGTRLRYVIREIVWDPSRRSGNLYRDNGTLVSDRVLAGSTYAPLIAAFYGDVDPVSLSDEAEQIAGIVLQAGWLNETLRRDPETRKPLSLIKESCEYSLVRWKTPMLPFVVVFALWLYGILARQGSGTPFRFYICARGVSFRVAPVPQES